MNAAQGRQGLLAGSATYLAANLVNAVIPFALLPVLTRYMVPAEYGQVAMYQVVLAALSGIVGLSVVSSANIKYYDDGITTEQLGSFIGACFQIMCMTVVVLVPVAIVARAPLAKWLGLEPLWLVWSVFASAANFTCLMRLGQWQVRGRAFRYGTFQVMQSLANAVLTLLLVVGFAQGAKGRIDAQNWVLAGSALVACGLLAKDRLIALSWRPDYLREALRFGVPLIPHILGIFLLGTVDRMMINSRRGLAAAGIYMVAVQLTLALPILFSAINNAYVPWLFERLKRNDPAEKRRIVAGTYAYFLVALALAGLAFLFGPLAVRIIAGARYVEAGSVLGWLALGHVFGGMYVMVTNYIFFSKRTGLLSVVTISSGLLNVALQFVLIGAWGIRGAAIAFATAMGLRFLLTWVVAHRRHPMPWSDFRLNDALKGTW
ncbi:MAG TPA: oligosaccharide flippase family protein [Xanthomonadaceae bacterium]|jgi:O-antigen/teichoic acid export membrane protein